ncbi:MAG: hypothetical protein DHS20C18_48590 [Saprospiraceae bacterium]|nr:MAG: hypothetical protein DHS20C18_48590 [Saprospiraceae bacterium]
MKEINTNWSKEDLKAYLLLYCANADFVETEEEVNLIQSKVGEDRYKNIHIEFDQDNDYQKIQKIQANLEKHNYSKEQIDSLFQEMKELFLTDGNYDTLEQNLWRGLKRLLN